MRWSHEAFQLINVELFEKKWIYPKNNENVLRFPWMRLYLRWNRFAENFDSWKIPNHQQYQCIEKTDSSKIPTCRNLHDSSKITMKSWKSSHFKISWKVEFDMSSFWSHLDQSGFHEFLWINFRNSSLIMNLWFPFICILSIRTKCL